MIRGSRLLPAVLVIAAAAAGSSCGYHSGLTLPEGAETLGIAIFGNESRERNLEREFHDELSASLARRLRGRIVSARHADLVVRGTILHFWRQGGIRDTDNKLLETVVRIGVEARLERRREGEEPEVLARTRRSAESGYVIDDPTRPGATASDSTARQRVIRNLADRLVLDLFSAVVYETGP